MFRNSVIFLILVLVVCLSGCSSEKSNPVSVQPDLSIDSPIPLPETNVDDSNRNLLGTWTLQLNPETLTATIEPNREVNRHYSVGSSIEPPTIVVTYWDPVTETVHVSVTIKNSSYISVFDVRLIIYTDDIGHMLSNADDWTGLWDIHEGLPINPFMAYAKTETQRNFQAQASYTENLHIYCPESNYDIQFAIDACFPGNCEEPYEISDFTQGVLYNRIGASTDVEVTVLDWQGDTSEVHLYCPDITGGPLLPFTQIEPEIWECELINETSASAGEYVGYVIAYSSNSGSLALYDEVKITISPYGVPLNPVNIGEYRTILAGSYDICTENGDLYAFYENSILTIDISSLANPEIIGTFSIDNPYSGGNRFFDVSSNYALIAFSGGYVADTTLYVIDISIPSDMEIVGSLNCSYYTYEITYDGDFAVLRTRNELLIIDLNSPNNPFITGILEIEANGPIIKGDYIYTEIEDGYDNMVAIIDINDPENPTVLSQYMPKNNGYSSLSIALSGLVLCVGSYPCPESDAYSYVETVDVSDPYNPFILDYVEFHSWHQDGAIDRIHAIAAGDDFIIIDREHNHSYFEYENLIHVLHLGSNGNLTLKGEITSKSFGAGAVVGDFAYVDNFGLGVIDLNTIEYNHGFYPLYATSLKVTETGLAYVGSAYNSVCTIDVSAPSAPQLLSYHDLGIFNISEMDTLDDYLYLTLYDMYQWADDRIAILDISDPNLMNEVSYITADCDLGFILCSGEYLYVDAGDCGLLVYDISNPLNLMQVGTIAIYNISGLSGKDNYLYVITYSPDKLFVVDINDPLNPLITEEIECNRTRDIEVQGNYAYVLRNDYLSIYDITTPSNPVEISEFEHNADSSYRIDVSGDYIYFAKTGDIWDISDLYNPQFLTQMDIPDVDQPFFRYFHCEVVDNHAYFDCKPYGLQIYKLW